LFNDYAVIRLNFGGSAAFGAFIISVPLLTFVMFGFMYDQV